MAETEFLTVSDLTYALFYIERVAIVNLLIMLFLTQNMHSLFSAFLFTISHAGYLLLYRISPNTFHWEICELSVFLFERIAILMWILSCFGTYKFIWGIVMCLLALSNMFCILTSLVWNFCDTIPEELNYNAETDKENSLIEEESSEELKSGSFEELAETFVASELNENTITENVEVNDHEKDEAAETKHNVENDQVSFKQETKQSQDEENKSSAVDIPTLVDVNVKLQTEIMKQYQQIKMLHNEWRMSLQASISSGANALTGTTRGSYKDREIICKLVAENKDVSAKLDTANKSLEQYRIREIQFKNERCRLKEETDNLSEKLFSTTNWYQHYLQAAQDLEAKYSAIVEEKSWLAAELQAAHTMSKHYQSCNRDLEKTCRELWQEKVNLCAVISAESSSAQHCSDLVSEYEEKFRCLEEDKSTLTAKLIAAEAEAGVYRSLLHDVDP